MEKRSPWMVWVHGNGILAVALAAAFIAAVTALRAPALGGMKPADVRLAGFGVAVWLVVYSVVWHVPRRRAEAVPGPTKRLEVENAWRGTLAQILAGSFFLVTAYATWRGTQLSEANLALTTERQTTDRFTKAVEQLGDDSVTVRLGGMSALGQVAHESPHFPALVIDVATAFLRERRAEGVVAKRLPISPDAQGAIWVLGKRRWAVPRGVVLDLSGLSLQGVSAWGADFSGATFEGSRLYGADFSNAVLISASFKYAELGRARLRGAHLERADLRFSALEGADLDGAHLEGADLRRLDLRRTVGLTPAQLNSANTEGAKLPEAIN
jgi:hypothetical protein